MIFTDAKGRPLPRPERRDFATDLDFVRARHDWKRALESEASAAVYHAAAARDDARLFATLDCLAVADRESEPPPDFEG